MPSSATRGRHKRFLSAKNRHLACAHLLSPTTTHPLSARSPPVGAVDIGWLRSAGFATMPLMMTSQEYLEAYDRQLRTDAETPSAIAVERLGPLRLVTFAGGRGCRMRPRTKKHGRFFKPWQWSLG